RHRRTHLRAVLPPACGSGRRAGERRRRLDGRHRSALARSHARTRVEVPRRQLLRSSGAALTGSLAGLLFANALYVVIGVGLLTLLRVARTRGELAARLGLAYIGGVAAAGALAAHL